ncbi:hypothetical protein QQ045_007550 [Rhodiola kirilowii]
MASRGGDRFRPRRDFTPRPEDSKSQRLNAPPSRHLWVGNLSLNIDERTLADQFYNFGELESVAFQPGRSYAFVNFKREEEAVAAMRALQGFPLGGMTLKIEFTKADKSSASSRVQDYSQHRDDQRTARDSRTHNEIIEPHFSDKSRMNEKDDEPCEVLWIGFPASLRVDETIIRKAFAPFGEIEKITVFPGRSYAFVRFRDVMSACRAKETLQGKLFGNPRVHICFSKSESSSSHGGRGSSNVPPSPATHFNYNVPPRFAVNRDERNFPGLLGDPNMRSPSFLQNEEHGHPDAFGYSRDGSFWTAGNNAHEKRRFSEMEPELHFSEDRYEHRRSPIKERDPQFPGYSPQRVSKRSPLYEEPWDVQEEKYSFHGTKKSKPDPFSSEKDLPEYPLSGYDYVKPVGSRVFPDHSQPPPIDRFSDPPRSFGYRQKADHTINMAPHHQEGRNKSSYESFQSVSGNLPLNPLGQNAFIPEPRVVSKKEWKWEGTIAKSGTPVCRARCFPVGKVMDNSLPSILDCTARTGLEMLAKHFYSAADSWVVFFAPQSDADIGLYDEFMHYLAERQRAAVAKLDDLHTLFLVPPSEFSEKVLRVPGKLSISGLVLRLDHPVINFGSANTNNMNDPSSMHLPGDPRIPRSISPRPITEPGSLPSFGFSGRHNTLYPDNKPTSGTPLSLPPPPPLPPYSAASNVFANKNNESFRDGRQEYQLRHQQNLSPPPGWSDLMQNPAPASNGQTRPSNAYNNTMTQERQAIQSNSQEWSSSKYGYGNQNSVSGGTRFPDEETNANPPSSFSLSSIPSEQLAQLASSLLGKRTEITPNSSSTTDFRQTGLSYQQTENSYQMPQGGPSGFPPHQLGQSHPQQYQQQQISSIQQFQPQQQIQSTPLAPLSSQFEQQTGKQVGSQVAQSGTTRDEPADADPQKRLQATLQLAAALLQQIQQGKGT